MHVFNNSYNNNKKEITEFATENVPIFNMSKQSTYYPTFMSLVEDN